jgi:hypothetical protein
MNRPGSDSPLGGRIPKLVGVGFGDWGKKDGFNSPGVKFLQVLAFTEGKRLATKNFELVKRRR